MALGFSPANSFALDLYVAPNGNDTNPGTQSAPYQTIGRASSVAAGTTVHEAPGIYQEFLKTTGDGRASARIVYKSDQKWGAKIVPPVTRSSDTLWWSKGYYTDVVGFDIDGTGGSSALLYGLYLSGSSATAQNNHVHHIAWTSTSCTGSGGAGIEGDSWYGGTNIDIIGNVVNNIGATGCSYIQGIYQSAPGKIKNNLVYAVGAYGIHLWHDANHFDIANNTVFGCGYGLVVGGGDFVHTAGPADYVNVTNNIIFDNGGGIDEEGSTGSHNTYSYNLVFKNAAYDWRLKTSAHTNDVTGNPLFVNYIREGGGDYHLTSTSPAVNKGTSAYAPLNDLDGQQRTAPYDIGAYEYIPVTIAPAPKWTFCANEDRTCAFNGTKTIRYGANGNYVTKTLTGPVACNNATFGDPAKGFVKHCDIWTQ